MKYSQVFQESQEFIYNLSVFDLFVQSGSVGKTIAGFVSGTSITNYIQYFSSYIHVY